MAVKVKIRNPKFEIRNKFKIQNPKLAEPEPKRKVFGRNMGAKKWEKLKPFCAQFKKDEAKSENGNPKTAKTIPAAD